MDSLRLAEEISRESVKKGVETDVLIEVNAAGEESKFGVSPEEVLSLVTAVSELPAVHIKGLMTIAPYTENPEENRKYFSLLKQLSVDITRKNVDNVSMSVLSMGMTNDYEVAVEEGATYVRVGTGIFGLRSLAVQLRTVRLILNKESFIIWELWTKNRYTYRAERWKRMTDTMTMILR